MNRYFDIVSKEYIDAMFSFTCSDSFFMDYLIIDALPDKTNNMGITHLFIEESENHEKTVLGFYTLKNSSLIFQDDAILGYPAMEISQFATNEKVERQGNYEKYYKVE